MSKSPHTPEFRAMVSQKYLDDIWSYNFPDNKFSIYFTPVSDISGSFF